MLPRAMKYAPSKTSLPQRKDAGSMFFAAT
jgi:hypothetical protein